ncbi:MAG: hypothetical protein U5N27_17170 [Rhizobium sp.]|nr:hypothetical protein [Rhizobium sp.]
MAGLLFSLLRSKVASGSKVKVKHALRTRFGNDPGQNRRVEVDFHMNPEAWLMDRSVRLMVVTGEVS